MGEVIVYVDIDASIDKIFDLVKDTEAVMGFMPSGWEVEVTKITEGPIQEGTEFHVKAKKGLLGIDYIDRIDRLVKNREIFSSSEQGTSFSLLRWALETLSGKIRLTRHVKYALPYSILGWLMDKLWVENAFRKEGEIRWLQNIKSHLEK